MLNYFLLNHKLCYRNNETFFRYVGPGVHEWGPSSYTMWMHTKKRTPELRDPRVLGIVVTNWTRRTPQARASDGHPVLYK